MQLILPLSRSICVRLLIVLIVACAAGFTSAMETFHMNNKCGQTINMVWKSIYTARIQYDTTSYTAGDHAAPDIARENVAPQYGESTDTDESCDIGVQSWNFLDRIMFYFSDINIDGNCSDVHLEILDGPSLNSRPIAGLPRSVCGSDARRLQSTPLVTSGRYMTIRLRGHSSVRQRTSFSLVVVSFHEGACQSFEHACASGRCIMSELVCNGFNPCGDYSDCFSPQPVPQTVAPEESHVIIVVVVTISLLVVVCVVVAIAFCKCYHARRKHRGRPYTEGQPTSDTEAAGTSHELSRTLSDTEIERLHSPPSYNSLQKAKEQSEVDETSSNCSCIEPTNPLPPSYSCVMTHQDMFHLSTTSLHKVRECAENSEPT